MGEFYGAISAMSLIKIILLLSLGSTFFLYICFLRSTTLDRLAVLAIFFAGVLGITFPQLTTYFAKIFGVGRGADLIFYLFIVFALFIFVLLYSEVMRLSRQQTELAPYIALRNARHK